MQVWDDSQILSGDNWAEKLAEGLEQSDAMVVLFTPDSAHADVIRQSEVGYALGKKDFKNKLIAVVAGSPEEMPREEIHWVFSRLNTIYLSDPERNEKGLREISQLLKEAA